LKFSVKADIIKYSKKAPDIPCVRIRKLKIIKALKNQGFYLFV